MLAAEVPNLEFQVFVVHSLNIESHSCKSLELSRLTWHSLHNLIKVQFIYIGEPLKSEHTENRCLSSVVEPDDNDAHLLCADEPAKELREQKSHF